MEWGWTTTSVVMAALAAFAAFCGWRASVPVDLAKPRLVPWIPLMLTAVVGALIMALHLVNLAGVETGR